MQELVPKCPGIVGGRMAIESQGSVLHPPPQARKVPPGELLGPFSTCPLPSQKEHHFTFLQGQ